MYARDEYADLTSLSPVSPNVIRAKFVQTNTIHIYSIFKALAIEPAYMQEPNPLGTL